MSQMCVKREMKRLCYKAIGDNEFNLIWCALGSRAGARKDIGSNIMLCVATKANTT